MAPFCDARVGQRQRQAVARRERERPVERGVLVIGNDEQAREPGVYLFRREAVGMGMEPIEARTVSYPEVEGLLCARRDRVEPRPVLRFGQREAVEMNGRGLRQAVLDDATEALAGPRNEDRLCDALVPQVRAVAGQPRHGIDALGDQPANRLQWNDSAGGKRG